MNNLIEIEKQIIARSIDMKIVKTQLNLYKEKLDYFMNRFIDQYGTKLDIDNCDKYNQFAKHQNEEYAKVTRLVRVLAAYQKV
jgi:hypothetical protein